MVRIMHVSDTHGKFDDLKGYFDIIVHSGDMLGDGPKVHRKDPYNLCTYAEKADWQETWVTNHIEDFKAWIGKKVFLFTFGNHDFFDPFLFEKFLQGHGIKAYCLHDKIVTHEGTNFYGFPYIPFINGRWAYEEQIPEMSKKLDIMAEALNKSYVDCIVAHCPPADKLSYDFKQGRNFGNTVMCNALDYKINEGFLPAYYLTGHIHSAHSVSNRNGMIVSNAATVQHILEV